MSQVAEISSLHWDQQVTMERRARTRFWESPPLQALVNDRFRRATGCSTSIEFISAQTGQSRFEVAISIGCGEAQEEIAFLKHGFVGHFILVDFSKEQLKRAKNYADSLGVNTSRITFLSEINVGKELSSKIDLVYWRMALHHMLDTDLAVKWSVDVLRGSGAIYCNEYCGPNRMQFSDEMMFWAERARDSLPKQYLRVPFGNGEHYPLRPTIPTADEWLSIDPTECADSENIIPALQKYAPNTKIAYLGGAMYHLALNDIIDNFKDGQDDHLLKAIMLSDDILAEKGVNQYFTSVSRV